MEEYKCDKCGVEITTGMMALFCPREKECQFYVPEVDAFKKDYVDAQEGK